MTVTQIADGRGVKKHIHIDGEYSFTVDNDFLSMSGIYVGLQLDDEYIEKLKADYQLYRTKKRALDLLSRRSHSAYELKTKLKQRSSEEDASAAVQRMEELGYIDDRSFAENYARELWERKFFARSRIKRELFAKGVSSDIADDVIEGFDDDEKERIRLIISKKYVLKLRDEKGRNSVFSQLARLGYSYSDIRSVMSEYSDIDFFEG